MYAQVILDLQNSKKFKTFLKPILDDSLEKKSLNWEFARDDCLFLSIVCMLVHNIILTYCSFNAKTSAEGCSLKGNLCEFKTILTDYLFLYIFNVVGPTSDYLQSYEIDILSAWFMVKCGNKQFIR